MGRRGTGKKRKENRYTHTAANLNPPLMCHWGHRTDPSRVYKWFKYHQ